MVDQQVVILWVNAILITLTLCAVVSRAGRKIFVVGNFGGHDGCIVLAAVSPNPPIPLKTPYTHALQVSATIFSIFQMVSTGFGLGLHQASVNPSNMPELRKVTLNPSQHSIYSII